jgi:hypothetical protein
MQWRAVNRIRDRVRRRPWTPRRHTTLYTKPSEGEEVRARIYDARTKAERERQAQRDASRKMGGR